MNTPQAVQPYGLLQYLIPIAVFAVIFAFRWRRMAQERPLKLERLWIVPVLYALVAITLFATSPPAGYGWAACALALVVGGVLGWQRGRMMRITVDPGTHQLNHRASPVAVLFILLIVILRQGLRNQTLDQALGLDAILVTDMAVALALGLLSVQRLEMYLRGKRLLAEARSARP